ncbi:MAG TPA: hypothetical protein GXZ48_03985 [Acholeplasmataceae bacterium]|jgi:uncharacterized membrane protein|nr:hypothetical protein [Acholeplasmataceae bacterium]
MKKALSYFLIGAITSTAVWYTLEKNHTLDNIKREKKKMAEKFKAMFQ